jgi:hypothetical protein
MSKLFHCPTLSLTRFRNYAVTFSEDGKVTEVGPRPGEE